jgi:hypothetical protein
MRDLSLLFERIRGLDSGTEILCIIRFGSANLMSVLEKSNMLKKKNWNSSSINKELICYRIPPIDI